MNRAGASVIASRRSRGAGRPRVWWQPAGRLGDRGDRRYRRDGWRWRRRQRGRGTHGCAVPARRRDLGRRAWRGRRRPRSAVRRHAAGANGAAVIRGDDDRDVDREHRNHRHRTAVRERPSVHDGSGLGRGSRNHRLSGRRRTRRFRKDVRRRRRFDSRCRSGPRITGPRRRTRASISPLRPAARPSPASGRDGHPAFR